MTKKRDSLMVAGTEVPLSYTKKGKLDKKSREAILEAKEFKIAQNITHQVDSTDVINVLTFLGLAVAYKQGVINYLPKIFDFLGQVGEIGAEAVTALGESIRDASDFLSGQGTRDISEDDLQYYYALGPWNTELIAEALSRATKDTKKAKTDEEYKKWQQAQNEVTNWLKRIEELDEDIDHAVEIGDMDMLEALRQRRMIWQRARDQKVLVMQQRWADFQAVANGDPKPSQTTEEQDEEQEKTLGFWDRHVNMSLWMAAFGASGLTIKFFDAMTFDKAVEMTPVIQ